MERSKQVGDAIAGLCSIKAKEDSIHISRQQTEGPSLSTRDRMRITVGWKAKS